MNDHYRPPEFLNYVTFPQPPASMVEQAEAARIKKRFIFSYATYVAMERLHFSMTECAVYAGMKRPYNIKYRYTIVKKKLYVFDPDEMERYIKKVMVDLRLFVLARRLSAPLIGLAGPCTGTLKYMAGRLHEELGGQLIDTYDIASRMVSRLTGLDLADYDVGENNRERMGYFMRLLSKKLDGGSGYVTALREATDHRRSRFTIIQDARHRDEAYFIHFRGGALCNILCPGYYSEGDKTFGIADQRFTAMTFKGYTRKEQDRAIEFIVAVATASARMGYVKAKLPGD